MSGSHSERKGSVYPIPLKSKRPVSIYPVKDLKKIQSPLVKPPFKVQSPWEPAFFEASLGIRHWALGIFRVKALPTICF